MATEKIRVGIIGASTRNGWARDAHIPALSALPEFEITAVSTSRQETADETAKYFGIPHAFADPCKMVQHPDVDLVSICVRVPFSGGHPRCRADRPSPGDLHTGLRIHRTWRAGRQTAVRSFDTGEPSLGSRRGPG